MVHSILIELIERSVRETLRTCACATGPIPNLEVPFRVVTTATENLGFPSEMPHRQSRRVQYMKLHTVAWKATKSYIDGCGAMNVDFEVVLRHG
jgi:hypothetical protein